MHDARMHRCATSTIAILILDFMKFEVSEKDFPDFLAWLRARFCIPSLDARIDAFAGNGVASCKVLYPIVRCSD